ncbi:MAG TPA: cytochrome c oxidase subunit II, partial [Acidimicrobiia bacterium]
MRPRPATFFRRAALLLPAILLLGSCISDAPMDSLDPAGPIARRIDGLFWLTFGVAAVIFVIVEGGILIAAFVFRDRKSRKEAKEPKQTHGNPKLEVAWTVVPVLILVALAVPTVKTVFDLTDASGAQMQVDVIGHQWWFEYRYPDSGVTTANVLVIPEDTEVALNLTSQDVIHSFWVPRLAGKRYAVPGHQTVLLIQADDPGEYWGQCGEYCGLSHSLMRARVVVMTAADFEQWVAGQQLPAAEPAFGSPAEQGREVFLSAGCTQCHIIAGVNDQTVQAAPNLTHFASRGVFAGATLDRTPESIARWLANPP